MTTMHTEALLVALENALEEARGVYRQTEGIVDQGEDFENLANSINDESFVELQRAAQLIRYARYIREHGAYPTYPRRNDSSRLLLNKGREQTERLQRHLTHVGLRDDNSQLIRKSHSQSFIDCLEHVQYCREHVYDDKPAPSMYYSYARTLEDEIEDPHFDIRLLDGIVNCSIEAIKAMANAVRSLTRITP